MDSAQIRTYCMSKHAAEETYPFGPVPICYKLGGKIFAQLYPYPEDYKITLKCTPDVGQTYRVVYPDVVARGYHCPQAQQPYWNTIDLKRFPDDELVHLIDHAYDTVLRSFSRRIQRELAADEFGSR